MVYILLNTFDSGSYAGRVVSRHHTLEAAETAAKLVAPGAE